MSTPGQIVSVALRTAEGEIIARLREGTVRIKIGDQVVTAQAQTIYEILPDSAPTILGDPIKTDSPSPLAVLNGRRAA